MNITVVQYASNSATYTSGSSHSLTVTLGSNPAPGNVLVAMLSSVDPNFATPTIPGPSGDNWSAFYELQDSVGGQAVAVFVDAPVSTQGTSVSCAFSWAQAATSSNSYAVFAEVYEISGASTNAGSYDGPGYEEGDATGVTSWNTTATSGSVSTTHPNEIWFGVVNAFVLSSSTAATFTPSSSFTNKTAVGATIDYGGSPYDIYQQSGYEIVSSTGTLNYPGTISTSSSVDTIAVGIPAGGSTVQPDVPQILPGPTWLDRFKPGLPRPRPAIPPPSSGPYLLNNAEGLSNNQSASAGDSGGLSGNAFDQVDIGSGAVVKGDSSRAAHGNLSYRISTPATGTPADLAWSTQLTTQPQFWFRLYLYFTENPVNNHRLIEFTTTAFAAACGGLLVTTAGNLEMVDAGGTVRITSTSTIPISKWFRVEGFITGSATAGQLEFKLFTVMDGTTPLEVQTSANTLNTTGAAGSVKIGPGIYSIANVGPFWVDDIGVSANGYIGPASGISINRADVAGISPGPTWLDTYKPGWPKPRPPVPIPAPSAAGVSLGVAAVTIATPAPGVSGAGVALAVATVTISAPQIAVGESFPLGVCTVAIATPAPTVSGAGLALTAATVAIATPATGMAVSVALSPATVAVAAAAPGVGPLSVSLGVATVTIAVPAITPAIAGLDFPRIAPGPAWLDHFKPGLPKPPPFLPQRITPGGVHLGVCTVAIAVPAITPAYAPLIDLAPATVTITVHPIEYSRTLIISIASQAGTDDYGNSFPEGLSLGPSSAPQVQSNLQSTGTSWTFPLNNAGFLGGNDSAEMGAQVVAGSPPYATLNLSGPSAALAGHQDYVEVALDSANTSGTSSANMEFYYISSSGGATVTAAWDGTGWTFYEGVVVENGLQVSGGTTTDSLTVTGNIDANTSTINIANGNIDLNMAVPVNYPNSHISTTPTSAEFNAIVDTLNALIASMIARGLIT